MNFNEIPTPEQLLQNEYDPFTDESMFLQSAERLDSSSTFSGDWTSSSLDHTEFADNSVHSPTPPTPPPPTVPIPGHHPNSVKKGDGPEGKLRNGHPKDNYAYKENYFFNYLQHHLGKQPTKPVVMGLLHLVLKRYGDRLKKPVRPVYRRVPCAYGWLDDHRKCIESAWLSECLPELRRLSCTVHH
jgi:hypothetical protein